MGGEEDVQEEIKGIVSLVVTTVEEVQAGKPGAFPRNNLETNG
jgi:hypothetical protein